MPTALENLTTKPIGELSNMVAPCNHFQLLERRLTELATKFIDDQVQAETKDPATFQPDLDRLAAFRLLIHAEIEDFLEARAKENINAVTSLIAAGSGWMRAAPEIFFLASVLKRAAPQNDFEVERYATHAQEVLVAAKNAIRDNNGIKSSQFMFLSICAGKMLDEVDGALSASLNSFGKSRGDVAHKSVTHCTTLQAPSTELHTARMLVSQIGTYFGIAP